MLLRPAAPHSSRPFSSRLSSSRLSSSRLSSSRLSSSLLLLSALTCTTFAAPAVHAIAPPALTAPVDSEASEAASGVAPGAAPAAEALPKAAYFHRKTTRHSSARRSARSLPSRGIVSPSEQAASVVGRLAQVTSDQAAIVGGRETGSRVLSVCPKDQYLAVSGQTNTQYAVLMIDHSIGFVNKSDVKLLDVPVATTTPDAVGDGSAPAVGGGPLGQALVRSAQGYLGVPYVWGGTTAAGIDCSGFVRAVYSANGLSLPRVSGDQAQVGYDVPKNDWSKWLPGDRMYFACHHPRIDHTAMYIGGGYFIHASMGHGQAVAIDRVDGAYYAAHLVCVRRSPQLVADAAAAPGPQSASSSDSYARDPEADQR